MEGGNLEELVEDEIDEPEDTEKEEEPKDKKEQLKQTQEDKWLKIYLDSNSSCDVSDIDE